MKTIRLLLAYLALATFHMQLPTAFAQNTSFTFQGVLSQSGGPANGPHDFTFTLYDSATAGSALASSNVIPDVLITNGLFTVTLDYGSIPWNGPARWLEIAVRPGASTGAYTNLAPRQAITATPHAVTAGNLSGTLPATQLTGTVPDARLSAAVSLFGPSIDSAEVTDGTIINADISPGAAIADIKLSTISTAGKVADTSLSANVTRLGASIDSAEITDGAIMTNDLNASLLNGTFWKLGGNTGANPANGFFLGTTDNQPLEFRINNQRALRLQSGPFSPNFIGGFSDNTVVPSASGATIVGGGSEGAPNQVTDSLGTVGGGRKNTAAYNGTVAGGEANTASGAYSTIPGGANNTAAGDGSFAAGTSAKANHNGAFVWADDNLSSEFVSSAANQFLIRAAGGVAIGTNDPAGAALRVASTNTRAVVVETTSRANNTFGVHGVSTAMAPGLFSAGVRGESRGTNDRGIGVYGSQEGNGFGVYGATKSGYGVMGHSEGGIGVGGYSLRTNQLAAQFWNQASGGGPVATFETYSSVNTADVVQVIGHANATGNLLVLKKGSNPTAVFGANGSLALSGALTAATLTGNGTFTVNHPNGTVSVVNDQFTPALVMTGGPAPGILRVRNALEIWPNIGGTSAGKLDVRDTSGAVQFVADGSTGNVGIGTASPGFRLEVNGTAGKTGGGSWSVASDARLKKNVENLHGSLDRLLRLRSVSFEYQDPAKGVGAGPQIGFIAQEVREVLPQWVSEGPDGMLAVSVTGFESLAVDALRELRAEKDRQLAEVKSENAELKRRLEKMEQLVAQKFNGEAL